MKKHTWLTILTALILLLGSAGAARAEILPPYGEGQIGFAAEILCAELTLREEPSASSKAVKALQYGDFLIVIRQSDGWAYCTLGDSEDSLKGWVNADYIAIDPARYRTEGTTPVYAWNDTEAPKVALLDKDTTLPILKEEGDWLLVSLRGAVGWIHK
ncbi:MAG: SH3 domain-containing protein [Clostridia bacterium]|nr:SH3 domain-containing protein [Clostridia bacterium]MBR0408311.1 SH3 domain-containing protein [Clostridia bacterium]